MQLLALGLNHRTAPLPLRERAALAAAAVPPELAELRARAEVREAAIISTCNRTELYCQYANPSRRNLRLGLDWFACRAGFHNTEMAENFYHFADAQAVKHAFRVGAGLDSMVVGEPQILGQMKQAYHAAAAAGACGKVLNQLFQRTFAVAKQVRTDTAVGRHAVSVAYAAVSIARRIFARLSEQTVLLIGAGETVELMARHLAEQGVQNLIIANRSVAKAEILARNFSNLRAEAIPLTQLSSRLAEADIIATATASTLPILGQGAVAAARAARRHKPILILDLAVPRDVEPAAGRLRDVYLYTVDDLQSVVARHRALRADAAKRAETIIDLHVVRFMRWLRAQGAVHTIRAWRQELDEIGRMEAAQAIGKINRGQDPRAVADELARRLTRKFAHHPTAVLRRAEMDGDANLAAAARKLFGLPPTGTPRRK